VSAVVANNGITITDTPLPGVRIIDTNRFTDERGWFAEVWNAGRYRAAGLELAIVQDNVSFSRRGVLRGMHFQWPHAQGKLISVLSGAVFDACIDVRGGSPTFGRWFGSVLSDENRQQLWVPEGFAHGFLVLSDTALVHYNCTAPYDARSDRAVAWNDPDVGIEWPYQPTIVSQKDQAAPRLADLPPESLPSFV
jgi:dTDP-4-dehydrorhamnose 3,5-epimerase